MDYKEMVSRLRAVRDQMSEMKKRSLQEKRNLTEEEYVTYNALRNEEDELRSLAEESERESRRLEQERQAELLRSVQVQKEGDRRSAPNLVRIIREVTTGDVSEETRTLLARGREEMKASGAPESAGGFNLPFSTLSRDLTVTSQGDKVVATDLKQVTGPLYNELVLTQAGAQMLTGLRGNIEFPRYTGTTSAWEGETTKATAKSGTFDSVKFSPKRLATVLEYSQQFFLQDSVGAVEMLRSDMIASIKQKLESTILGSQAKSGNVPAGLLSGTVTNKGAASYARAVDLIAEVKGKNALKGRPAFITNAQGEAILSKTLVDASGTYGFLAKDGKLNGYPLFVTENVGKVGTEQGLLFADWSDFIICNWGGLNIIADNVTKADEGLVRLIINTYWDFGFRRDESVTKASISMAVSGV